MEVFSDTICALGEGPLWHPTRKQLFWFDIIGKKMLSRTTAGEQVWLFDDHVSAAGWVSDTVLLIASERELFTFDVETSAREHVAPLDGDNPVTRSNDGRADPQGGFWIGTMGKGHEPRAGAIYRYYRGAVRQLVDQVTVSNAICFSPDGRYAYYTDTVRKRIMRSELDAEGWPLGEPQVFIDLREEGVFPDGAVVDASGHLWNAQWGASRVACYAPDGSFVRAVAVPATQASCPCFGADGLRTLYVTTAAVGMDRIKDPKAGMTFVQQMDVTGQAEHRVIL
ncbi:MULTISPECIES: SMP-30/gluconolactonase/LRE family protein [Roseobacteraceae]|jgi:sugar lactone lactonase YvrE|uniref:L-arabinolactonase n=1 Tax=Pseudosulfitobacter pseudonitzschiae TaxID=1402135 RepID=A0A221K1T9_9RHOB|nr:MULTISPECIES: SMP-30/gluconolactonase/LRE family protein [Roseobacteraceae]ASM72939.1 L-arabinolactonase [Pseudosulfitobacter pseudonitzschiae]